MIRRAVEGDGPRIARMHWDSHQSTYVDSGLVERARIEAWTLDQRTEAWERMVDESLRGDRTVFVAVRVDQVVGFADARSVDAADAPRGLELKGLYVLDEYHGSGVGQSLLDETIGDRPAFVWVLAGETRARAFYRRNRFEPDGIEAPFESWGVTAVRLVR